LDWKGLELAVEKKPCNVWAELVTLCYLLIYRMSEKYCTFFKFAYSSAQNAFCFFGGRHLENFVPTGTAGISIKTRSI
jgi:hypothetical protein